MLSKSPRCYLLPLDLGVCLPCILSVVCLLFNKQLYSNSLQDTNTKYTPMSGGAALYRDSVVYFCPNDLRHVTAAENKMQHHAKTNTAYDPGDTTKIRVTHRHTHINTLICSISSEVRAGPERE